MRVVLQLRPATELIASVIDPTVRVAPGDVVGELSGFDLDHAFEPVAVPGVATGGPAYSLLPADASVLVRGDVDDTSDDILATLSGSPTVTGVFADPIIHRTLTCGGNPAVGTWHDVASLLHTDDLAAAGLTGNGVALALVDTGINADRVNQVRGGTFTIDTVRSWNPQGVTGTAAEGLYTLRVTDSAAQRMSESESGATVFADPRIEPASEPESPQ